MSKAGNIFVSLSVAFISSCGDDSSPTILDRLLPSQSWEISAEEKEWDSLYFPLLGKWKCNAHDELWMDSKYIFFGCDDFPIMSTYEIKNDSIFSHWTLDPKNPNLRDKVKIPKIISTDTIQWDTTIYYRVASGIPQIDTTKEWEKEALTEIVLRRKELIKRHDK